MSSPISNEVLFIERVFDAPIEKVFRAWTEPDALRSWFGPEGFKTVLAEVDLCVGGKYRLGLQSYDGDMQYVTGTYRVIQPPHKLVFTWVWAYEISNPNEEIMLVTLQLAAEGGSTYVKLTHENLPNQASYESHEGGWVACFIQLDKWLVGA